WRGTEARRVQIAVEMVATGDYLVPRLWGEPTFAKPPFYYWVLAAQLHAFGLHEWSMRLPSVLAFFALAVLGFHLLSRWHGRAAGWLGAAGLLVAPVVTFDVPFAEIDPVFAALTAASLLFLAEGVLRARRAALVAAGVLGALAILTKGPPYLMFCAGPLVCWWRHSRLRGWAFFLPWLPLLWGGYRLLLGPAAGAADVGDTAVDESLGRLEFWHPQALAGIPSHLLRSVLLMGLPFSPWLWKWWRETRRATDLASRQQSFLVFAAAGAALILLLARDRPTRYMLPAVPLLVFGLAPLAAQSLRSTAPLPGAVAHALRWFGALCAIALLVMPWLPFPYPGLTPIALAALATAFWWVGSARRITAYALAMPLLVGWFAYPDRVRYFAADSDFAPTPAAVLARACTVRGVREVGTYGDVGTSVLMYTREGVPGLQIHGDPTMRRPPQQRFVLVQDRGSVKRPERAAVEWRELPGYRDVLRVQMGRSKSVSLRERQ
ncbi:MAG: glycosyltransferase family 39 protein, partial [Planctomycetes bacterium]|nr:glycosyltransferase family 39 protein [Planctomycetota bacterium]